MRALSPRFALPAIGAAVIGAVVTILTGPLEGVLATLAVLMLSALFWMSSNMGGGGKPTELPDLQDMPASSRVRLIPLYKLHQEIRDLIDTNPNNPVVSVLKDDLEGEVQAVLKAAIELLDARRRLQKLLVGMPRARMAVDELEARLDSEQDERTRAAIEASLTARREELLAFERLELAQKRLDADLDQAESALAELRSRVVVAVADTSGERKALEEEQLDELGQRLKTLGRTMEESAAMIRLENW